METLGAAAVLLLALAALAGVIWAGGRLLK